VKAADERSLNCVIPEPNADGPKQRRPAFRPGACDFELYRICRGTETGFRKPSTTTSRRT